MHPFLLMLFIQGLWAGDNHTVYAEYKSIYLLGIISLCLAIGTGVSWTIKKEVTISITAVDMGVSLLFVIVVTSAWFSSQPYHFENSVMAFSYLLIYAVARHCIGTAKVVSFFFYLIIVLGLLQVLVGIYQLFSDPVHRFGNVCGTFNSPALFGLIQGISLILLAGQYQDLKHKKILFFTAMVLFSFGVSISGSRTSICCTAIGILLLCRGEFQKINCRLPKRRKAFVVAVSSLAAIFAGFVLLLINPHSVEGRVLVWKICGQIFLKHPWIGIGPGNFSSQYAWQQAHYFAATQRNEAEIYLADLVSVPYNEYLNILLSFGITGFVVWLIVFGLVLLTKRKTLMDAGTPQQYHTIGAALSLLLLSGMTSFPSTSICISAVSAMLLSMFCSTKAVIFRFRINTLCVIPVIAIAIYCVLPLYQKLAVIQKWEYEAVVLRTNTSQASALSGYQHCLPWLAHAPQFLYEYGLVLYRNGRYDECINTLTIAGRSIMNKDILLYIGSCFEKKKNNAQAEYYYRVACNMMPHHLYPKYRLFCLYVNVKDDGHARNEAKEIVQIKQKRHTPLGDQIQAIALSHLQ